MTETPTQPSSESTGPRPKRRWLQFNLRTLLILTLVFGCGLGWISNERRKNAILQADIDAFKSIGCEANCRQDDSFQPTRFDWLLGRKNFGIDSLNCGIRPITDAGLERLNGMTSLISLQLNDTAITDAGLAHLKGLTKLEFLSLNDTAITDAGLEHLKGLTNLKTLFLDATAITDAGLEHLKGLALRRLDLRCTKATKGGVAELEKALPNCWIYYEAKEHSYR